jgi:predicted histone-like DNA-binding protein
MSVIFKTVAHKNLQNLEAPAKHYAMVEPTGITDIDGLAKIIADNSTASRADVYLVIIGLVDAISRELEDGRKVHLGKLGSFSLSISSDGADTASEVTAFSIKKARLIFRPGPEIRNLLKKLKFKKKS